MARFLLLLTAVTTLVIFFIFFCLSTPQLIGWDEAGFIWLAGQFRQLIAQGDWPQFFALTAKQDFYPFFQGWYLAIFTFFAPYSYLVARLASTIWLLPTVIFSFLIIKRLDNKKLPTILLVFTILTSPTVLFFYSLALKEGMGQALTVIALYFYFIGQKRNWPLLFAGLIATLLFLTKYNFGLLLIAAIVCDITIQLIILRDIKVIVKKALFFVLALVLVLPFWFARVSGGWQGLWLFLQNVPDSHLPVVGHLLFYPLEILNFATLSWPLSVVMFAGFVYSLKNIKKSEVRTLAFLFLLNLFLAMRNFDKHQFRYLFTSLPAFFILGSYGAGQLSAKIRVKKIPGFWQGVAVSFVLICLGLIAFDMAKLPVLARSAGDHFIGSAVFYEQDYQKADRFNHYKYNLLDVPAPMYSERVEDVYDFIFANVDVTKNVSLVGQANEFSQYLFIHEMMFSPKKSRPQTAFSDFVVTFEVDKAGRFDTFDFRQNNAWGQTLVNQVKENKTYILIAQKHFDYLGVRVMVFGKEVF